MQPDLSNDAVQAYEMQRVALEHELLNDIPLTQAMALRVIAYNGSTLMLAAPLAANINDKGCAFGGSLTSVMTLAGWGLVKLALDAQKLACDIYVQESTTRYLAPVWSDFTAIARLATDESFADFFATVRARGKGRATVQCEIPLPEGGIAATLTARFVALTVKKMR